ncbi:unnamed protein product [Blepharisma stoltei]|uniref:CCHC-type domain-containing protein n=1 Tax=Blepharisma stoltei TaxID=1481888 RepID=A0AAU9JBN4_9CILI|nr:unnamed protein product [Blepharisma stoltei]
MSSLQNPATKHAQPDSMAIYQEVNPETPQKRLRPAHASESDLKESLENLDLNSSIRSKTRAELEQKLFSDEAIPRKQAKIASDTESDVSMEPGEIPEHLGENFDVAAEIFGPAPEPGQAEARKIEFEPYDYISQYGTAEDIMLKQLDIPERLQISLKNREYPTEAELNLEEEWLLQRLLQKNPHGIKGAIKAKIHTFLLLYRVEKYEISFIYKYRLDVLKPEIETENDLLELWAWDKDWGFLYSTKQNLQNLLNSAAANGDALSKGRPLNDGDKVLVSETPGILPDCVSALLNSHSTNDYLLEINDLEAYIKAYVYTHQDGSRMLRKAYNPVQESRMNKLNEFAAKAGLSPSQISENLKQNKQVHKPLKPDLKPQGLAFKLRSPTFSEEIQVITNACNLMQAELSNFPAFRSFIREEYKKHVKIYTSPTEKGKTVLDVFHPFYGVKNLANGKPIDSWSPELWGQALKCESSDLIKIEFKLPWEDAKEDKIFNLVKGLYTTVTTESVESEWNQFRTEVLKLTFAQLYKEFEDSFKKQLLSKSEDWIIEQIQSKFSEMLNRPSYIVEGSNNPCVVSIVTDPDVKFLGQTAVVALKRNGDIIDIALLNTLMVRKPEELHETDKARYLKERSQFINLLLASKPNAIIIGANSLQSVQLRRSIGLLAEALTVDSFNEMEIGVEVDKAQLFSKTPLITMGDTNIAKLFATSQRSIKMCENHKVLTRMAISLGRSLQNPKAEILGLWNDPNELQIKYLSLHPLESLANEHKKLASMEIVAVCVCSHSGVDINEVMHKPHLYGLLSFIPGLGPVRAYSLIESIKHICGGTLTTRQEILTKRILPQRVCENACGFIKIPYELGKTNPLDSTRIHPEYYELAAIVSKSALNDEQVPDELLIHEILRSPQKMQELDLDYYAQMQAEKGFKNMKETLEFIVSELSSPFGNPKKRYFEPTPEELLYMCTNETPSTLKRGSVVQVMVLGYDERRECLRCLLECELEGIIEQRHLVEGRIPNEADLKKFVKGGKLTARIIEVTAKLRSQKDLFFKMKLSLLPDDIINHGKFINLTLDEAFIIEEGDWTEKTVMEDEQKTGQKYVPRVINHLKYRNVGMRTACDELSSKEIGDFIFRPSSRGQDHLTCTWKFYDYIYAHLDIIEEGKPSANMLGSRFRIGTEVYESLQDAVDRYIAPCEKLVREAITHPKFKETNSASLTVLENLISQEKTTRPTTVPYYFAVTPHYPQYFVLLYQKTDQIIKEFIKVKPKGLFFHEAYHPNMGFLISWFKRHCNDLSYLSQLSRSKPPNIDTSNAFLTQNKPPEQDENAQVVSQTPARTPGWGNATPYDKTPHIGAQEWSGGKDLTKTPRADEWGSTSNFESWGGEEKKQEASNSAPKNSGGWGGSSGASQPPAQSSGGWGGGNSSASQQSSGGWGGGGEENKQSSGGWGGSSQGGQSSGASWGGSQEKSGGSWGESSGESWGSSAPQVPSTNWGGSEDNDQSADRGSRGGRGGRGRGRGCFKCGQEGHMSKDCPNPGENKPKGCFKCGQEGHMSRECPNPGESKPKGCFKCGQEGHMSRECPNPGESKPKGCFKCGQEGHMSRECPNPGESKPKGCFKCGQEGHMSRECPNPGESKPKGCFKCGQEGHMSRDCPNPGENRGRGRGRGRGRRESGDNDRENSNSGSSGWADSGSSSAGWGSSGGSSGGWGDSGSTTQASSSGWGDAGSSTQASSGGWGGSTETTQSSSSSWGGSTTQPASSGGWGDSSTPAPTTSGGGGWGGSSSTSSQPTSSTPASSSWGNPPAEQAPASSSWNSAPAPQQSSWNSTPAQSNEKPGESNTSSWGAKPAESSGNSWGNSSSGSSWG